MDKRTGPPDWVLIAAIAMVTAFHVRSVYKILRNPDVREVFIRNIRGLPHTRKVVTDHVEPIGSTWLKETGL
jgi:hypothetical protein